MTKISRRILSTALVALAATAAWAQGGDGAMRPLTMVGFGKAKAGMGEEATAALKAMYQASLDKGVAEGRILSWGIVRPFMHEAGGWTHALFTSAPDWSAVDAQEQAAMTAVGAMDEAHRKAAMGRVMDAFEPDSHWDLCARNVVFHSKEGAPPPRYFLLSSLHAVDGQEMAAEKLFKEEVEPLYTKLLADGVINSFGLMVPELHGDVPWSHQLWVALPNLAAMDRIEQAWMGLGEEKLADLDARFREVFQRAGHEDTILEVVHFGGPQAMDGK